MKNPIQSLKDGSAGAYRWLRSSHLNLLLAGLVAIGLLASVSIFAAAGDKHQIRIKLPRPGATVNQNFPIQVKFKPADNSDNFYIGVYLDDHLIDVRSREGRGTRNEVAEVYEFKYGRDSKDRNVKAFDRNVLKPGEHTITAYACQHSAPGSPCRGTDVLSQAQIRFTVQDNLAITTSQNQQPITVEAPSADKKLIGKNTLTDTCSADDIDQVVFGVNVAEAKDKDKKKKDKKKKKKKKDKKKKDKKKKKKKKDKDKGGGDSSDDDQAHNGDNQDEGEGAECDDTKTDLVAVPGGNPLVTDDGSAAPAPNQDGGNFDTEQAKVDFLNELNQGLSLDFPNIIRPLAATAYAANERPTGVVTVKAFTESLDVEGQPDERLADVPFTVSPACEDTQAVTADGLFDYGIAKFNGCQAGTYTVTAGKLSGYQPINDKQQVTVTANSNTEIKMVFRSVEVGPRSQVLVPTTDTEVLTSATTIGGGTVAPADEDATVNAEKKGKGKGKGKDKKKDKKGDKKKDKGDKKKKKNKDKKGDKKKKGKNKNKGGGGDNDDGGDSSDDADAINHVLTPFADAKAPFCSLTSLANTQATVDTFSLLFEGPSKQNKARPITLTAKVDGQVTDTQRVTDFAGNRNKPLKLAPVFDGRDHLVELTGTVAPITNNQKPTGGTNTGASDSTLTCDLAVNVKGTQQPADGPGETPGQPADGPGVEPTPRNGGAGGAIDAVQELPKTGQAGLLTFLGFLISAGLYYGIRGIRGKIASR